MNEKQFIKKNKNNDKLYLILIICISFIILIGFLIYYLKPDVKNITKNENNENILPNENISIKRPDNSEFQNKDNIPQKDRGDFFIKKLSDRPVSGYFIYSQNEEIFIRYALKENSYIQEINLKEPEKKNKIVSDLLPQIYESVWIDKDNIIFRYFDGQNIKSIWGNIKKETLEKKILSDNIDEIDIRDGNVFYLARKNNEASGVFYERNNYKIGKEVFKNNINQWIPYLYKNGILLTLKPESNSPGFSYYVDFNNPNNFQKIIYSKKGLTVLPDNLSQKLIIGHKDNNNNKNKLEIYNTLNNKTKSLRIFGYPEKCVWQEKNIFCASSKNNSTSNIEDWYLGNITFSDTIYEITEENVFEIIELENETQEKIDAIKLNSIKNQYLFFINKIDDSLWVIKLK